jgi:uncharacterized membrane protein YgcG
VLGHLHASGAPSSEFLDAASLALVAMDLTRNVVQRALQQTTRMLSSTALGKGDSALAAQWAQLAALLAVAVALPIGAMWMALPALLPLVCTRTHVVALAATYARLSAIWLVPQLWIECLTAWLGAHRWVLLPSITGAAALVANLAFNLLLVLPPVGFGFAGAALATSCTRVLQCITLLVAVRWHSHRSQRAKTNGDECGEAAGGDGGGGSGGGGSSSGGGSGGGGSGGTALAALFDASTLRTAVHPTRLRIFVVTQALPVTLAAVSEELQFAAMAYACKRLEHDVCLDALERCSVG